MFIRTVAESKTLPVDTRSGAVGGYEDLTREILRHFESCGFLNPVIVQCDKEMSIIHVCRTCARKNGENSVTICAENKSSEQ